MAIKAIDQLINRTKIDINEVDAIIVSTITPDMLFPSTACLIQNHFKIKNCWGFDLSAACSGFLFGLETGNNLIISGKYNKIIVHGHTPQEKIEKFPCRVNIDTGSFYSGKLSCLVIKNEQLSFLDTL